ncbi:MAG: hypothetical protein ABJF88_10855 [Rhodothermales bacterium]
MNRSLFARVLLAFSLSLTLVACDSNDEDDVDALVGRWNVNEEASRTLITVSQAQQVIDRSQPGQGGIQVTGDLSGTLRYFGYAYRDGDDLAFYVGSHNYQNFDAPYPQFELFLDSNSLSLRYYTSEDDSGQTYFSNAASSYSFSNNVLTVNDVTLTNGSEEVTVDGSLTFATRSVPANQETEIDSYRDAEEDFQLEFEADGDLLIRDDDGTERGTWEKVGDRLRLTFDDDDDDTILVSYDIDGNTLSMSFTDDDCEGEAECLDYVEQEYLLEEGSLTRVRYEESISLTRASSNRAVPSDGASARGDRPSARPWPARPAPARKGLFGTSR